MTQMTVSGRLKNTNPLVAALESGRQFNRLAFHLQLDQLFPRTEIGPGNTWIRVDRCEALDACRLLQETARALALEPKALQNLREHLSGFTEFLCSVQQAETNYEVSQFEGFRDSFKDEYQKGGDRAIDQLFSFLHERSQWIVSLRRKIADALTGQAFQSFSLGELIDQGIRPVSRRRGYVPPRNPSTGREPWGLSREIRASSHPTSTGMKR
jgi:hypothetical protein